MITVEDGTGLSAANSYVSEGAFRAYCADLGRDVTGFDAAAVEGALRRGFRFVNTRGPFKSSVKVNDQGGEFPRVDLSDGAGRVWNVVPPAVRDAQCEAAWLDLSGVELQQSLDRGVKSEAVGPISTTYADDGPRQTRHSAVEDLLDPYKRCALNQPVPVHVGGDEADDTPHFGTGMHDATGTEY
jgi:DnaT-like ssDNA binding protein